MCVYCNGPLVEKCTEDPLFEVKWPWGETTNHKQLRIGREPPAPPFLIKRLTDKGYDNVSRTHADIFVDRGEIVIEDLGSTNGTFVGSERLNARKRQSFGHNATVRIASNLLCEIRILA